MGLTFEKAMELLEITDILKLQISDIQQIEKKAKKRWHPDKVIHLNNSALTEEYTINFQMIDSAVEIISAYINGTYHAGDAFTDTKQNNHRQPEDIIRENAPEMQATLRALWQEIKVKKYKWYQKEVILSEGYKLRDILTEDFKEDLAILSIVSFFYGTISLGLLNIVARAISPVVSVTIGFVWMLQALSCILGFLPLSRFWLPQTMQEAMFKFINFGLGVFNWAEQKGMESSGPWVSLFVMIPVLFAKLVKYVVLLPLYELTKAIIGHKVVGVVKKYVDYYAYAADWYIEELISADPKNMSNENLLHLSDIYGALSDVRQNT